MLRIDYIALHKSKVPQSFFLNKAVEYKNKYAGMAELADAYDSGNLS